MALKNLALWEKVQEKFPDFSFRVVTRAGKDACHVQGVNFPLRKNGTVPTLQELLEKPVEDFLTGRDLMRCKAEVGAKRRERHLAKQRARRQARYLGTDRERQPSGGWSY